MGQVTCLYSLLRSQQTGRRILLIILSSSMKAQVKSFTRTSPKVLILSK
jgi:hypothetical protein